MLRQTPMNEGHNPDILALMPGNWQRVVEIGCSGGALAREYKKRNPGCAYTGLEIDKTYAEAARRHCDRVLVGNIEQLSEVELASLAPADCWIFGDVLEHLRDPWSVLARVRTQLGQNDCVIACIPNMQHWSVQANLLAGRIFYQDSGLFDRTHLRWFTRLSIVEMFTKAGYKIETGVPRVFDSSAGAKVIEIIRAGAMALGLNPEVAVNDALALQYVVKAVAAGS